MTIRTLFLSVLATSALLVSSGAQAVAESNVALLKPVTLTQGTTLGAALSTLTDGTFLGVGTEYTTGTVFWATSNAPVFELDLGAVYSISSIKLEHDNNDTYLALYPLGTGVGMASFSQAPTAGGMNQTSFLFSSPITASKLTFIGLGGDGLYALSEIQVTGVAVVPEPGSYGMMLAGLALMGGVIARRRRSKSAT